MRPQSFAPSRARHLALSCAIALQAMAGVLSAQQSGVNQSWSVLRSSVSPGTPVTVTRLDHSRLEGKLLAIDDRSITVGPENVRQVVDASNVLRVELAGVRRRRVLQYGVPFGMLAGGLVTMAIDNRSKHPEPGQAFAMGAVFAGLPLGALAATAIPLGPPLYEAAGQTAAR